MRLAGWATILEGWKVRFSIRPQEILVCSQMIGDLWGPSTLNKLPFEVVGDGGEAFDFLLKIANEVFHACAVEADLCLEQLCLSLFDCSLCLLLLCQVTRNFSCTTFLVLDGLWR